MNRIQLAVYFGIGKYISYHTRKNKWGTGALEVISQQLRKELPGLRGFSVTSLKNMRKFYENWKMLDPNSSVVTDEFSAIAMVDLQDNDNQPIEKSAIMIADLHDYKIDIYQAIKVPETKDFPIEDFFKLPFTHHIRILEAVDDLLARYYYIHRAVQENMQTRALEKILLENAYGHKDLLPSNFCQTLPNSTLARKAMMMFKDEYFKVKKPHENPSIGIVLCKSANRDYVEFVIRDYNKPMGVATYTSSADMPENLRNALPDVEELKKLLGE